MMMFLRFTPFLLIYCMQYSAKAQSVQEYQKIKDSADSLARIKEFPKSEAMYLKALKVFDQDPVLHINLASLYLKMQKTDDAKKFMKSAIVKGADMDMLLLDTSIKNYLVVNQEDGVRYSSLSKQHKSLIQLTDKTRWIDDFRVFFEDNGKL
jgi:tetratricopeptide (TPR) repeat protein